MGCQVCMAGYGGVLRSICKYLCLVGAEDKAGRCEANKSPDRRKSQRQTRKGK